ncbi:MAG: transcription termination factor NusA, partial [Coriobacteriales bacterium]
ALMELAREKDIDELDLLDNLERSLADSYRKILDLDPDHECRVTIDRSTGHIYVFELAPTEDAVYDEETDTFSDYDEFDVTPNDVSRIAAQNAKNVINSIVRQAGRQQIYREFVGRKGELITGTVLQSTPDFTILKIRDGVEAELPHFDLRRHPGESNERPYNEHYQHNARLKAIIIDVRDPSSTQANARGESTRPTIVVSRTHPDLIRRLFELEVPEIYDGVVEIRSIAREPGARSKVAVASLEHNLDPVGACVGPKGSRVKSVVNELRGENVDIIQWSDDPATYVGNALSPAKVSSVGIDEESHSATVIVPDEQLSLAIGKEGQNARLAARLTGWRIDIKSASLVLSASQPNLLIEEDAPGDEGEDDDQRCEYVSPQGVRCRNHAREGSRFCGIHDALGAQAAGARDGD